MASRPAPGHFAGTRLHVVTGKGGTGKTTVAAALAIAHGLAPRLAAAIVGYGIVLSLVTLPLWRWVLLQVA